MYYILFVISDEISKKIQCVCKSKELCPIFTLMMQGNYHNLEGGKEREGARGRKWGREGKEGRKIAKWWNKSNIELKLSNFRYHRNCYQDFVHKLQINGAKNTYDQTSSDKVPFNYILKSILSKENKMWNTNKLLDAYWNKGCTELNSTCVVNNSISTAFERWDLSFQGTRSFNNHHALEKGIHNTKSSC